MANLIIKPTSGGLLKLQEDGGTDAISIGTDGKSTITHANITAWTPPAGTIIQVVQASATAGVETSSQTYVSAGLSKAITPSATSSKVLISVNQTQDLPAAGRAARYALYKNGSIHLDNFCYCHADDSRIITNLNHLYLDSPSTTSAVTYELYFKTFGAGVHKARYNNMVSTMILMEVSG